MYLNMKIFFSPQCLNTFEYMKTPLSLFPLWMIEQFNLKKLALDGWVYIEMIRAVWGLPQAGILANKPKNTSVRNWHRLDTLSVSTLLVDGTMTPDQSSSPLW
jgi:hypothetical protein